MRLHWDHRTKRKTRLAVWLSSLDEMPEWEIIQEIAKEFKYEAEEYWTKLLRQVKSVSLLNVNDGQKHTIKGYKRPPEVSEKMRLAHQRHKEAGLSNRSYANRVRGENNPMAKLTHAEALAIKYSTGSLRNVAAEFGVSWITVRNIRLRKTWKHLALYNAGVVYRSARDPVKILERVQLSSLARLKIEREKMCSSQSWSQEWPLIPIFITGLLMGFLVIKHGSRKVQLWTVFLALIGVLISTALIINYKNGGC